MNEKVDVMWNYIKEMREEMKKQSELFKNGMAEMKKKSELFELGMARLEMKLDTVLLKNLEEKAAVDSEDDSITNPVVSFHSTDAVTEVKADGADSRDAVTEVKEDGADIGELVVQKENSCTEADGIIEVQQVPAQTLETRAPTENVMKRRKRPTVEELKNFFWWLVDTEYERWPLSCILCGGKMHSNMKQLEKHDTGKDRRIALLTCNKFEKLQRYVAAEKLRLATELELDVNSVFFYLQRML